MVNFRHTFIFAYFKIIIVVPKKSLEKIFILERRKTELEPKTRHGIN